MVFEGSDGSLGSIATVSVGWYKLVVDVFMAHPVLDEFGALIVEEVEAGAAPGIDEGGRRNGGH